MEQIFAEIFGKPRGGFRTGQPRDPAATEGAEREDGKQSAGFQDFRNGRAGFNPIDHTRRNKRDKAFNDSFSENEQKRQNGRGFVFPNAGGELFQHKTSPFCQNQNGF